jgi:hypothetical protein
MEISKETEPDFGDTPAGTGGSGGGVLGQVQQQMVIHLL